MSEELEDLILCEIHSILLLQHVGQIFLFTEFEDDIQLIVFYESLIALYYVRMLCLLDQFCLVVCFLLLDFEHVSHIDLLEYESLAI